ncbi:MAG: hypothetical protein KF861_19475 [Planctomycetaceae bacterium]|nr:hypothetical protein [Planctomycetaceae bacterium]
MPLGRKPFLFRFQNGQLKRIAFYTDCPHCAQEIRAAEKYMGAKVACKFCNGALQFVESIAMS